MVDLTDVIDVTLIKVIIGAINKILIMGQFE